jgi:THO complex subunit 3
VVSPHPLTDGKCKATIQTPGQNINVAWSPDGNYIAVGNKHDVVSIIDVRKNQIVKNQEFKYEVNEMTWNPSGDTFLLTTSKGTVDLFSFPNFELLHSFQAHSGPCYVLEYDPLHQYIATGGADAMVTLWDTSDLVCVHSFPDNEYVL